MRANGGTSNDKNDVLGLYDGPHGDDLGIRKMASMHAGHILLPCEEEDAICGGIWQQKNWRKFDKFS